MAEHPPIRLIGCCLLVGDDFCDKPAEWRPANIPMPPFEWFCREHAVMIAEQVGVFGVYHVHRKDVVEELALPVEGSSIAPGGDEGV